MNNRNLICWKSDELVKIAPIDAGSNSGFDATSPAVFLATHQPQPLTHLPHFAAGSGELIDEEQLLSAFREPAGDDPEITVISGAVGTGKSHMVKWLHAQSIGKDQWHQIYVEKADTNLRKVIETILEGMTGPTVVELRAKLAQASSSITDLREAKAKVLGELAHLVEFPSGKSNNLSLHEGEARDCLELLLKDPVLKPHLLRDDGAIHRISRIAIDGLEKNDKSERDVFFSEEDLPLKPGDLHKAAAPTQGRISILNASPRTRAAAVEVLNQELAAAKKAVFVGSGIDLTSVFHEVRNELAQRGLELVLYIEDLVLLHGIDRELAQSFTIKRGKNGERCAMRVVIAATEGYLAEGFDTLNTRASHYSLNLKLGEEAPAALGKDFVGRYFNALRIGSAGIQQSWPRDNIGDDWIPNGCETCPERDECHDVFGTDSKGHGLYPLNAVSVEKLIRLSSGEGRFDPREIIRHVIHEPLRRAKEELPRGEFPSKKFAAQVDGHRAAVPIEVKALLEKSGIGQRQLSVLAYWVDGNDEGTKAVYSAFGLPEPTGGARHVPPGTTPNPTPPPDNKVSREIEDWVNQVRNLSAATANEIRKFVFDALVEQLRNGPSGLRVIKRSHVLVGGVKVEPKCIQIERAQGGGGDLPWDFKIEFDSSTSTGVLFKAIIEAEKSGSWPIGKLAELAGFIGNLDAASSRLADLSAKRRIDIEPAVRLLSVSNQQGLSKDLSLGELLEARLRKPEGFGQSNSWGEWRKVVTDVHESSFNLLEDLLSEAKGDGGSSSFDAAVVMDSLEKARRLRELKEPFKGTEKSVELQRRLSDVQNRAGVQLWAEMHKLLDAIGEFVEAGTKLDPLKSQVNATLVRAKNDGLLPRADSYEEIRSHSDSLDDSCADLFSTLVRAGAGQSPSIFDLMPDRTTSLVSLRDYCLKVSGLFGYLESRVDGGNGVTSSGPTVVSVAGLLRNTADKLDSIAGGGK